MPVVRELSALSLLLFGAVAPDRLGLWADRRNSVILFVEAIERSVVICESALGMGTAPRYFPLLHMATG